MAENGFPERKIRVKFMDHGTSCQYYDATYLRKGIRDKNHEAFL